MTGEGPAVEVGGLTKRYGQRPAVDGASFQVARGSVTALLGPNGAGKTTTVEVCEGFRKADGGRVRVLGEDPWTRGTALRARVGVMLQSGGVYPASRPAELLAAVARCYAHPHDPRSLIAALGLARVAGTPYRRLSGGERQRLALAVALVGRPELAFLDEPTAGLDPQARHSTWEIIGRLRASGVSVLLTTHYMHEAEELADQVVIIDRGRVLRSGTPGELTGTDATRQLRFRSRPGLDLAGLAPRLPPTVSTVEGPAGHYTVEGPVDAVGPDALAAVTGWCADNGVLASDIDVGHRTLEDVFLSLTGRELR